METQNQLSEISVELLEKVEHLLALFYAYARSETKIDEKEGEYKKQIAEKESQVKDMEGKVKELRDKLSMQTTMMQLHQQS